MTKYPILIVTGLLVVAVLAFIAWHRTGGAATGGSSMSVVHENRKGFTEWGEAAQGSSPQLLNAVRTAVRNQQRPLRMDEVATEHLEQQSARAIRAYTSGTYSDFADLLSASGLEPGEVWGNRNEETRQDTFEMLTATTRDAKLYPDAVRVEEIDGDWNSTRDLSSLLTGPGSGLTQQYVTQSRGSSDLFDAKASEIQVVEVILPGVMRYSNGIPLLGELRLRFARRNGTSVWHLMLVRIPQFNRDETGEGRAVVPPVE